MIRKYVQRNITLCAVIIFFITFGFVNFMKPTLFYNNDGTIRKFGVGYQKKTIVPVWLLAIILSILSYMGILYYLAYPKIKYY